MDHGSTFARRQLLDEHAPELLRSVTKRFGQAQIRVRGSSMLPAIKPGDVLAIVCAAIWEVKLHDIVVFQLGDRLLAHRVVSIHAEGDEMVLTTRGDRHAQPDPPVRESQLIGRVSDVVRGNSVLPTAKWNRAWHRGLNWWQ